MTINIELQSRNFLRVIIMTIIFHENPKIGWDWPWLMFIVRASVVKNDVQVQENFEQNCIAVE